MDFNPIDIILHLDAYLDMLVRDYGVWIYAILFLVIFCETGLVVMPFLPGDSLLFIAGAVAAGGGMDPVLLRRLAAEPRGQGRHLLLADFRHLRRHRLALALPRLEFIQLLHHVVGILAGQRGEQRRDGLTLRTVARYADYSNFMGSLSDV